MNRRQVLATGSSVAVLSLAGCPSFPTGDSAPEYPRGSLFVYNTSETALSVAVWTVDHSPRRTHEATVPAGEHVVVREFVSASPGTAVTLAARIGDGGEPTRFEFLPNGGGEGRAAPPEYARLVVQNAVEASASWTAREGT